jgi:hypothetical protein
VRGARFIHLIPGDLPRDHSNLHRYDTPMSLHLATHTHHSDWDATRAPTAQALLAQLDETAQR